MRKFAIFYNDGSVIEGGGDDDELVTMTFSKKWLEAPSDGVAAVISETASTGRTTLHANEFYYQLPEDGHGKGCHGASMKVGPYLRQLGICKFGGWTDDENHNNILSAAVGSTYVQRQSAKRRDASEDTSD